MAKTKNKAKDFQANAMSAIERGAGAVGAAVVANKLLPQMITDPSSPLLKHKGALLTVLGIAAEVFAPNEHVRKLGQGMSTFGMLRTANDYMPDEMKVQLPLGISGADAGVGRTVELDWTRLADESSSISGYDEPRVNGIGSGREYRPELAFSGSGEREELEEGVRRN